MSSVFPVIAALTASALFVGPVQAQLDPAVSAGAALAYAHPPPLAAPSEIDWREPDPQNLLVIDTDKGRVVVEMAPAIAPLHVARVRALARSGFYDGRTFFRVIDGFMDQTGDPKEDGTGGSTLPNLPPEFTFRRTSDMPLAVVTRADGLETGFMGAVPVISQSMDLGALTADGKVKAWGEFCAGTAGMARVAAEDSANSQFFLMRGSNTTLDAKYTLWGRAISGLDVLRAIKAGEPPPPPADKMLKVRVAADIPLAERPHVRVIDTNGPWFRALVARVRADKGQDFTICDLDIPAQVK